MSIRALTILFLFLSCLCLSQITTLAVENWETVAIPDAWKKQAGGHYGPNGGYGWYRCAVRVPDSWEGNELQLFMEAIDDAREVYLNGERVGGFGEFPPRYRSGLGADRRFPVPAKIVRAGELNIVAVRVYRSEGRGGFNVAAPALFAGEEAIHLSGDWQMRGGDEVAWASATELESLPSFAKVEDAAEVERTLKKLQGDDGPLAPAESLKRFTVADDLVVELALADPHIGQPLSVKWDERGRMWVMQYLQYPNPAGLTMISRDKFLRSVYDKVPPAPPNHFRGADKITIHEDTDNDGVYDKHKTFVEGLSLATSFARGRDGLWVLNPPYLLFYPDKDNDDVPDGDPEVHLEGFGIEDSHSVTNSLRWGPDGWLYATQGSTVTGNVRRYGTKDKPVHSLGQLVWRYHPATRRYEIFAEGGGNSFGVEFDSKGRVYSGHNGGDTRGFHYVQGGYFQKGFGKHGDLSNPYTFGYFPQMAHHSVPRFTHTFVIYEGDALPEHYDGKLFGVEPLQGRVVYSQIEPDRSSFKTKDLGHPLDSSDTWFRPVDIKVGPDGAIYVADLYEQRIDHASHYQGRVDTSNGRIYRLRGKQTQPTQPFDYSNLPTDELVAVLAHPNKWHREQALRLLADRQDTSVIPLLRKNIDEETGQLALESLWALYQLGGLSDEVALQTLNHNDPYVRSWTVRLVCDDRQVSAEIAGALAELARTELNVEARSQLACSARRLPADAARPLLAGLLARSEDTSDIHIPLLLWWAIEAKCEGDREMVLQLLADKTVWDYDIVDEHIIERLMRRFALSGKLDDLLTCAKLLDLAPEKEHAEKLLAGFEQAYAGRSLTGLPDELVAAIAKVGGGSLALRLRQSDPQAIKQALAVVVDAKAAAQERVSYLRIFGQIGEPSCVPVLLKLAENANDDSVRAAALGALQSYDDPRIGVSVVRQFNNLTGDSRDVAQEMLASRGSWSLALVQAIEAGDIPRDTIPLPVVRKMLLHQDKEIAALVQKQWGTIAGATTEEMFERIQRITAVIGEGSGNPYAGKKLFAQHCGKCHQLFGEGGFVGPDLTPFARDDLQRALVNVVNPSIEIREGFENFVVYTLDGRVLNGFVEDQNNQVVVLRSTDGRSTVIKKDDIDEMAAVKQSVMPEGVLKPLSDQQIRDLFAYFRSSQPLP